VTVESNAAAATWDASTKMIVDDARSAALVAALVERGWPNVLALADRGRLEDLRRAAGPLAAKLHPMRAPEQALSSDATVRWLDGDSDSLLWSRRSLRKLDWIAVRPRAALQVPLLARRLAGLAGPAGSLTIAGERWKLLRARGERKVRPRRWLSPEIGIAGFFAELERRRVRWMVLRWWDELPDRASGDVDLLVDDEDAPAFLEALGGKVGTIALDVYAAHGSRGMAFGGACYYPSGIAKGMLARSRVERGIRIPSPEDAFLSLAFHAVYHKGPRSGLATGLVGVTPDAKPKHDFAAILPRLAREAGIEIRGEPTMEALDELLAARGWRPPHDTLRKWSHKNPWIRAKWFRDARRRARPGWCVFVVRRSALELDLVGRIEREIAGHGFDLVERLPLDGDAAERFRVHARGGNWGRDEYVLDGGPPALFLVAHDRSPTRLRRRYARRYPDMDNGRIVSKRAIRDDVNAALPQARRSNFLHTSDNSDEAFEYLRIAFPERFESLRRDLEARAGGTRSAGIAPRA
jgi:hypothetical protein